MVVACSYYGCYNRKGKESYKKYVRKTNQKRKPRCKNNEESSSKTFSFHRFPSNAERRKLWAVAVGRMGADGNLWMPSPSSWLCSDHFRACDYKPLTDGKIKKLLKSTAVPIPVHSSRFIQMESKTGPLGATKMISE